MSLVLVALTATACDALRARPSDPGAPVDEALARPLCEARCEHAARCGADGACSCAWSRETDALRADWVHADIECLSAPACTTEADCEATASRAVGASPLAWPPVVLRCLQKGDECGGSSATCRRLVATTDELARDADACFAMACGDYRSCFRALWDARVASAVASWREKRRSRRPDPTPRSHVDESVTS